MARPVPGRPRRCSAGRTRGDRTVLIVPIRHHSPAAALQVGRLIRERRPRAVLIEGPADATPLIDQLLDAATVPPVALYAYERRGEDVRAAFYPFCAYSPEYVALRAGSEVGARGGVLRPAGQRDAGRGRKAPPPPLWPHRPAGEREPGAQHRRGADAGRRGERGAGVRGVHGGAGRGGRLRQLRGVLGGGVRAGGRAAARGGLRRGDGDVRRAGARVLLDPAATHGRSARASHGGGSARVAGAGVPDEAILLVCGAAHAATPIAAAHAQALSADTPEGPSPGSRTAGEHDRGADRADPVLVSAAERAGGVRCRGIGRPGSTSRSGSWTATTARRRGGRW